MAEQQHVEAVSALFAERYGQMVGFARRRLRDQGVPPSAADPEDIVQHSFTSRPSATRCKACCRRPIVHLSPVPLPLRLVQRREGGQPQGEARGERDAAA